MSVTSPEPGEPVVSMAALLAASRAAAAVSTPPTEDEAGADQPEALPQAEAA